MPDITMCKSVNSDSEICPKRQTCYRFKANPSQYRQSYFVTAPFNQIPQLFARDEIECEYYWELDK